MSERTYELRTLKDGRWLTEYRSYSQDDAIFHARELVGSRHYHEIRVVAETFDAAAGTYKERILFKHRTQNTIEAKPKDREPARRPQALRRPAKTVSPWSRLVRWLIS